MENQKIPVAVNRVSGNQPPQANARIEDRQEVQGYHSPLIDIHEGPDGLVLEADLPGASDNLLTIQLEDKVLSLHARLAPPAPEGSRAIHEEYRVGDFYRSFILSDEVERDKITAELKNGVLRLHLPRAERVKTRRIEVKS